MPFGQKIRNRWNNLSLQVRLTLLYVGLLASLLCPLGGILYLDTRRFLYASTALRLRAQAKPVIERWLASGIPSETSPTSPTLPVAAPSTRQLQELTTIAAGLARALTSRDTTALVLDGDARVLANGRLLPEEPIPAPPDPTYTTRALAGENEVTYITTVADQRTLVLLIPLRPAPGSPEVLGLVQLSTLLALIDQILWRQRLLIAGGTLMTIIAGTLGGLWLTSSALAPLRRMIVTSRRIAAGDLSQRVDLPRHTDEVGQLAASFDDMVARIEAAFATQRRFVADAAHELRTPLTALQGSLEVLLRGSQDDPAAAARLTQGMYREVTRLSRLAEQLLDLSRLNTPTPLHQQQIALAPFLEEFAQQARLLAHERQVILEPGEPGTLYADPDMLKQMLFNLVDNAQQHTQEGGAIRLGWRVLPNAVEIRVADDGEGIAEEDLPHIFEPFYRGIRSRSRRRGGTGLGLALVRAITEAHGGQVEVSSQPDQGACFTITLPTNTR